MAKVNTTVIAPTGDTGYVTLFAGDEVPAELADVVTNPDVFDEVEEATGSEETAPKRTRKRSQ